MDLSIETRDDRFVAFSSAAFHRASRSFSFSSILAFLAAAFSSRSLASSSVCSGSDSDSDSDSSDSGYTVSSESTLMVFFSCATRSPLLPLPKMELILQGKLRAVIPFCRSLEELAVSAWCQRLVLQDAVHKWSKFAERLSEATVEMRMKSGKSLRSTINGLH